MTVSNGTDWEWSRGESVSQFLFVLIHPKTWADSVGRYRDTFAEVLVVGSILRKLEGDDKNQFERWRGGDQDQTLEIGKSARTDATAVEDLNQVADEQFKGITGLLFKRHTKQLRGKLFSGANQV